MSRRDQDTAHRHRASGARRIARCARRHCRRPAPACQGRLCAHAQRDGGTARDGPPRVVWFVHRSASADAADRPRGCPRRRPRRHRRAVRPRPGVGLRRLLRLGGGPQRRGPRIAHDGAGQALRARGGDHRPRRRVHDRRGSGADRRRRRVRRRRVGHERGLLQRGVNRRAEAPIPRRRRSVGGVNVASSEHVHTVHDAPAAALRHTVGDGIVPSPPSQGRRTASIAPRTRGAGGRG